MGDGRGGGVASHSLLTRLTVRDKLQCVTVRLNRPACSKSTSYGHTISGGFSCLEKIQRWIFRQESNLRSFNLVQRSDVFSYWPLAQLLETGLCSSGHKQGEGGSISSESIIKERQQAGE